MNDTPATNDSPMVHFKLAKEWNQPGVYFSIARIPNSSRILVGSADAKVREFDASAEKVEPKEWAVPDAAMLPHGYISGLAVCDKWAVSGASDGKLVWWDLENRTALRIQDGHAKWIRRVVSIPGRPWIASIADDMACRIWDAASGTMVRELLGHSAKTPHHFPSMLYACAVSADGKYLATGDRVGHVIVWEVETGKQTAVLEAPVMYTWDPKQRIHSIGGIRSLAFSPDGQLLVVGGMGPVGNIDHLEGLARLEIFRWQNGERLHELPGDTYKGLVEQIHFHPSGQWFAATGGDHTGFVKIVDPVSGKLLLQDKAPMHVHDMVRDETAANWIAVGNGRWILWSTTT